LSPVAFDLRLNFGLLACSKVIPNFLSVFGIGVDFKLYVSVVIIVNWLIFNEHSIIVVKVKIKLIHFHSQMIRKISGDANTSPAISASKYS
jgi:hypothetical protein